MTKKDLKIVFMGTPDFAVESLRILVENDYNIVGVITMPDKPAGRGHKLQFSAVKQYSLEKNLPLLQPDKLKDEQFLSDLKAWNADLQIVVAFRMLPEIVWDMPKLGTFNLHGSLLPQYRGAAPINWAIMNGESETGVTTFFLKHEIDTGEIILQEKVNITESDNVGKIYDDLMHLGAKLVRKTVDMIIAEDVKPMPQDQLYQSEGELKHAPKIFKETCKVNWNKDANEVHNQIRGLSPYPCAWALLNIGTDEEPVSVKIYESEIISNNVQHNIGSIITDNKTFLHVACANGLVSIKQMQMPGKRAMSIVDILNGYKFEENIKFS